ncbi:MAG: hypothetical protein ABSC94_01270 [Polyangiaceae bacterium]|jgi:hypothetical protein
MMSSRRADNLDDRAQNAQLRVGIAMIFVGLAASVAMHRHGASAARNLSLLPIFLVGAYGMAAGLSRTCGLTALSGRRRTAHGTEPIADRRELAAVRKRGMLLMLGSSFAAVVIALLLSVAR